MSLYPPASADRILRSRALALIDRCGSSIRGTAIKAGIAVSTLHRYLHLDPSAGNNRRAFDTDAMDRILSTLDLGPADLLQPVLLPGDAELIEWVRGRESAMVNEAPTVIDGTALPTIIERLANQGLLEVHGDPEDPSTLHLKLTPLAG